MIELPTNNPKILDALWMAYTLHQKQMDKGNVPYIFHPYNVALRVLEYFEKYNTLKYCADWGVCVCAALLHDTMEDCGYTWEKMNERFGVAIADTVEALTKRATKEINDYYVRLIEVNNALIVKVADLEENLRTNRIYNPTQRDIERNKHYQQRYHQCMIRFRSIAHNGTPCS